MTRIYSEEEVDEIRKELAAFYLIGQMKLREENTILKEEIAKLREGLK